MIIDEFPNLVAQTPALPSAIQIALSPRSHASRHTRTRLILCGSAQTVMRDLLGGGAPLRGRAKLELVLQPFWYREAASFWQLNDDPELAFRVHALLGGTPAYRAMAFGPPSSRESFDRWVVQRLLNPASAIFREGACYSGRNPVSLILLLITASSAPSRPVQHVVRRLLGESAGPPPPSLICWPGCNRSAWLPASMMHSGSGEGSTGSPIRSFGCMNS